MDNIVRNNIGRRSSKAIFLLVLAVLCLFVPYEFCSVYFNFLPTKIHYTQLALLFISIIIGTSGRGVAKSDSVLTKLFIIQILGIVVVDTLNGMFLWAIGETITAMLALSLVILICNKSDLYDFHNKYNIWICIVAALSALSFILSFSGLIKPIGSAPDIFGDDRIIYNYGITFSKDDFFFSGMFRPCGFFDEPGALAYWGLYALIFNKLFYNKKTLEILLTIFLLFSLSLGFYVQVAIYYALFYIDLRKPKHLILTASFIAIVVVGIYSTQGTKWDFVYQMTVNRIENTFSEAQESDDVIALGNRARMAELAQAEFKAHPLFGSPNIGKEYMLDNAYEPLARYGIVGCLFVFSPFLWLLFYSIKRKDYDVLKVLVVILVGFLHRPFHTQLLYFFILYSLVYMVRRRKQYIIQ